MLKFSLIITLQKVFTNYLIWSNLIVTFISFLSYPIISTLYLPEDYGMYSFIIVSVGVCNIFTNSQYNMSITLSHTESSRVNSFILSVVIGIAISILFSLIYLLYNGNLLYFLIFSSLLFGNTLNFNLIMLLTSIKEYKKLATSRIILISISILLQLILYSYHSYGLILSYVISLWITNIVLFFFLKNYIYIHWKFLSKRKTKYIILKFINLVKYGMPSDLINGIVGNFPTFIIEKYFSLHQLGLFNFAQKITMLPNGVISNAIGETFRQSAREELNKNKNTSSSFKKYLTTLFLANFFMYTAILLFVSYFFNWVIDPKWNDSIHIIIILSALYFLRGIVSPLTFLYQLYHKQKEDFLSHLAFLTILLFIGFLVYIDLINFIQFTIIYVLINILLYSFYGIRSYFFSLKKIQ